MIAEDDDDRANLEVEVSQMNNKWSSFHREVGETRQQINLSIDYFTLVEDVEQSFRTGSQMLVTVARKSTQVKTPGEATILLEEVDGFIKPQEAQLEHKITKISQMAIQLYGNFNLKYRVIHFLNKCVCVCVNDSRSRKFRSHPASASREPQHAGFFLGYECRTVNVGYKSESG